MALAAVIPRSFPLYVTHVDGEGPFLRISGRLDREASAMIDTLLETAREQLEHGVGAASSDSIREGIICAAKSDGNYCRVKITNVKNVASGLIGVYFIDFGKQDYISVSKIRYLDKYDPMLLRLSDQATCYYLSRVINPSGRWEEPMLCGLRSLLCNSECLAEIQVQTRNLLLASIQFKGNDLFTHLISNQLGKEIPIDDQEILLLNVIESQRVPNWQSQRTPGAGIALSTPPATMKPPFPSANPISPEKSLKMKGKLQYKLLGILPTGAKRSVLVSYVDNCIKFYIQLSDKLEELSSVMESVKVHCENSSSPGELAVGTPCCARFPDDGNWYRARVRDMKRGKVIVEYVDYGNEEEVEVSDLRTITPELLRQPAFAMKCALKGFENGMVETKTSSQLEGLTLEKTLMCHVVDVLYSDTVLVTLVDDSVVPPLDIARKMNQLSEPRGEMEVKPSTSIRKESGESFSSLEGSASDEGHERSSRRERSLKDELRPPDSDDQSSFQPSSLKERRQGFRREKRFDESRRPAASQDSNSDFPHRERIPRSRINLDVFNARVSNYLLPNNPKTPSRPSNTTFRVSVTRDNQREVHKERRSDDWGNPTGAGCARPERLRNEIGNLGRSGERGNLTPRGRAEMSEDNKFDKSWSQGSGDKVGRAPVKPRGKITQVQKEIRDPVPLKTPFKEPDVELGARKEVSMTMIADTLVRKQLAVAADDCSKVALNDEPIDMTFIVGQRILCRVTHVERYELFTVQVDLEENISTYGLTKLRTVPVEALALQCTLHHYSPESRHLLSLDQLKEKLTGNKFIVYVNDVDGITLVSTLYEVSTGAEVEIISPPLQGAFVSHVESLAKVYLQRTSNKHTIAFMREDLYKFYEEGSYGIPSTFKEKASCAAKSCDGNWYRGTVRSVDGDWVTVHFVDYGNTEIVAKDSLKELDPRFHLPHCLALEVDLGLVALREDAYVKLLEWTTGQEVQCNRRCLDGYVSKLHLDGVDLAMKLVEEKLAAIRAYKISCFENIDTPSSDQTVRLVDDGVRNKLEDQPGLVKVLPLRERFAARAREQILARAWNQTANVRAAARAWDLIEACAKILTEARARALPSCFVSHANSLSEFSIQLESDVAELEAMEATMVDAASFPELVERAEGLVCAARYPENGPWYRAQVLVHSSEGSEVLFMDYGNVSMVAEIRSLPDNLKAKPPLSRKCALQKPCHIESWSRNSQLVFYDLVDKIAPVFTVEFDASGDKSSVELYFEGVSISKSLVGLCKEQPPADSTDLATMQPKDVESELAVELKNTTGGETDDESESKMA